MALLAKSLPSLSARIVLRSNEPSFSQLATTYPATKATPRSLSPRTTRHSIGLKRPGPRPFVRNMSQSHDAASLKPRFSKGADEAALGASVDKLVSGGGRWTLAKGGEALERSFKFKTFAKTWDFMTAVSLQCKTRNHHPEWSNVYNTTFIRWTTHNPQGLSEKDVHLAQVCDNLARDFNEVVEEPPTAATKPDVPSGKLDSASGDGASCAMGNLADAAVSSAGNCCGPKK